MNVALILIVAWWLSIGLTMLAVWYVDAQSPPMPRDVSILTLIAGPVLLASVVCERWVGTWNHSK